MAHPSTSHRSASAPTVCDLAAELEQIAAMNIDALRAHWRQKRGAAAPDALTRDLLARALAHGLQEERLGGLAPHLRKLLATSGQNGSSPARYLKAGSLIVREHEGVVHEVVVLPGGFLWRGQTYSSLSAIALKITGTSWNGPRFFGLRAESETDRTEEATPKKLLITSELSSRAPSAPAFAKRGGAAV